MYIPEEITRLPIGEKVLPDHFIGIPPTEVQIIKS
jgi:hypothetical protein